MTPARLAFYGGVAVILALGILLINALPSLFDILTVSVWTVGGVVLGRKSTEWF